MMISLVANNKKLTMTIDLEHLDNNMEKLIDFILDNYAEQIVDELQMELEIPNYIIRAADLDQ